MRAGDDSRAKPLGGLILEHIGCQDEYRGDWAEDWPDASQAQLDELDAELAKVLGAWLDRHDLRPAFFTVPKPERKTKGEAIRAKAEADARVMT